MLVEPREQLRGVDLGRRSLGGSGPSFTSGNDGGALADTGSTAVRHGLLAAALVTAGAATTYAARRHVNH
ncbi:hypothetical protein [Streptomyces decoyicus]